jgi:hypothetical protein
LAGIAAGALLVFALFEPLLPSQEVLFVLVLAGGGFVGYLAFKTFFYVAVFLVGSGTGAMLATAASLLWPQAGDPIVVLSVAALAGGLSLIARETLVIVCTASVGAWYATGALVHVMTGERVSESFLLHDEVALNLAHGEVLFLACWLGVAALGIYVQRQKLSKRRSGGSSGRSVRKVRSSRPAPVTRTASA